MKAAAAPAARPGPPGPRAWPGRRPRPCWGGRPSIGTARPCGGHIADLERAGLGRKNGKASFFNSHHAGSSGRLVFFCRKALHRFEAFFLSLSRPFVLPQCLVDCWILFCKEVGKKLRLMPTGAMVKSVLVMLMKMTLRTKK